MLHTSLTDPLTELPITYPTRRLRGIFLQKNNSIILFERLFHRFLTFVLLSFDLSPSCKLQLIDLITVSAAYLAGWQTILVCFFFPRELLNGFAGKEKSQMDGQLKMQLDAFQYRYTPHVLSVESFAQYLRLQLKNFFTFISHRMAMQIL